jgi:hypothetical protein
MWSKADALFLRSLRIVAADPPAPLPRFRVEASDIEGEYRVIDTLRRYRSAFEFGPDWKDPRAAAEDLAGQLNEKHIAQK